MREDSWKHVVDVGPVVADDVVDDDKQAPEVQVAVPEHCAAALLVNVTVTPFFATVMLWPPIVVEKDVDVEVASVALKLVEVVVPHCPVRGTLTAES